MADEHLGVRLARLRRLAGLSLEELAARSGVPADAIRLLELRRTHSARLPALHALAAGLGVELTALLGPPPALAAGEAPAFTALRGALVSAPGEPPPPGADFSPSELRDRIADAWTRYHAAEFDAAMRTLPALIAEARSASASGSAGERAAGHAALAKALQLAAHVAVRMNETDLALACLECARAAAAQSADPLLVPMTANSTAWTYQRKGRLDDALTVALRAAEAMQRDGLTATADGLKVWGALTMSAATSAARGGDYERAAAMMAAAEKETERVNALGPGGDHRMVSVFSPSSVRIERVRLAVQFGRSAEALALAKGLRLSGDTPPSWRTWLLLDVARAHLDVGDGPGAVRTLESLRRIAPTWMRHHTQAVSLLRDLRALPHPPPGLGPLAEFLGVPGDG